MKSEEERRAIEQAYKEGNDVEGRSLNSIFDTWYLIDDHSDFNWHTCEYRIATEQSVKKKLDESNKKTQSFIDKMQTRIQVMQAYINGSKIEQRYVGRYVGNSGPTDFWVSRRIPSWDFENYEYRVKPEATTKD